MYPVSVIESFLKIVIKEKKKRSRTLTFRELMLQEDSRPPFFPCDWNLTLSSTISKDFPFSPKCSFECVLTHCGDTGLLLLWALHTCRRHQWTVPRKAGLQKCMQMRLRGVCPGMFVWLNRCFIGGWSSLFKFPFGSSVDLTSYAVIFYAAISL